MKQTGKINYIEIPSRNIESTKAFFSQVFNGSFIDYGPEYIAIENAGLDGGFYHSDLKATTNQGSMLVVIYSATLEQTLEKVASAGGKISQQIFAFPGGRRFHFIDPNGNEFAVWAEPSS